MNQLPSKDETVRERNASEEASWFTMSALSELRSRLRSLLGGQVSSLAVELFIAESAGKPRTAVAGEARVKPDSHAVSSEDLRTAANVVADWVTARGANVSSNTNVAENRIVFSVLLTEANP